MKNSFDHSSDVTDEIMKYVISNYEITGDVKQIKLEIHPIISNAMYFRENDVLEKERFKTLITLARALDDENLQKAIDALKYKLLLEK